MLAGQHLGDRLYKQELRALENRHHHVFLRIIPTVLDLHPHGNFASFSALRVDKRDAGRGDGQRVSSWYQIHLCYPPLIRALGKRLKEAGDAAIGSLRYKGDGGGVIVYHVAHKSLAYAHIH